MISLIYGRIYNFLKVPHYLCSVCVCTLYFSVLGPPVAQQSAEKETEKNHRDSAAHIAGILSQVIGPPQNLPI